VARALQRSIDLREEFEDSAKLVRAEADASITDPNHRLVALFLDREPNTAAPIGELAGIVEQVAHNLRQPNRVPGDVKGFGRERNGDFMTEALAERPDGFDGVVHDRGELGSLLAELDRAPTDAADVEQVVNLAYRVLHLPVQDL